MQLKHRGTKTIETTRLKLRKFACDDAESVFHNWAKDADVARYLSWSEHTSIEITREVLKKWTEAYVLPHSYEWGIELKESGELIGSIGLPRLEENSTIAEVGYCIGKKYWNKGIVTEALTAVMEFCFREVGFESVMARHDVENPASGRVMKKCGMRYLGCKPVIMLQKNDAVSMCDIFIITKSEWESLFLNDARPQDTETQ